MIRTKEKKRDKIFSDGILMTDHIKIARGAAALMTAGCLVWNLDFLTLLDMAPIDVSRRAEFTSEFDVSNDYMKMFVFQIRNLQLYLRCKATA